MTVTVTAVSQPANIPPRVQLTVTGTTEKTTTVTRLNGDGSSVPVRTSDGGPLVLSGATTLYDYEMGFGEAVSYSSLESPSTVSTQVAVAVAQVWLIHPGVPGLSMPVQNFRPGTWAKRTAIVKQGVFYPMGRTNPVIISDGARRGLQASMTILTRSQDERDWLGALISDAGTLLLNIPLGLGYSMKTSYVGLGDADYSPVIDKVFEDWLDVTLPFYVVDRPAGGSQAQRTYADLLSFASYQSLEAAYSDYTHLLAGP
jgi:hypothetical protein